MKRKLSLICCLLAVTLVSSIALFACQSIDDSSVSYREPTASELEEILGIVEYDHKQQVKEQTAGDYELVNIYVYGDSAAYLKYEVTVDTANGAKADDVKVVTSTEKENTVVVQVNSKTTVDVNYKLTLTLTDKNGTAYTREDGTTYSADFNHVVPRYTLVNFEQFVAAADAGSKQTVTVVGYLVGIVSTTSGSSKGCIYLIDKEGHGYYAYKPAGVPGDAVKNDEQLREAWPVGTEIQVSGVPACPFGQYEFDYGCTVTKTGNKITQEELNKYYRDATEDWGKATDNTDKSLIPYQNSLVELKGAKFTSYSGKYYYFTVNGVQYNIFNTNYFMDGEDVKTLLDKYVSGKQATIKGLVSVYDKKYQIYPLGLDCIDNVQDTTFSAQEKIKTTISELASSVTTKYTQDAENQTLPAAGTTFSDVTITWSLDKDYDGITLNNGVLSVELQTVVQTFNLTATLTNGGVTETKVFEISVDAKELVEYEPVAITAPAAGEYKIFMDTTAKGGSILYFNGTLNNRGALVSTDKASEAATVVVAAVEGKAGVYTLKVRDKYLVGYLNGTYNNLKLADEAGEWTWNDEIKTFVTTFMTVNKNNESYEATFYFGTYFNAKNNTVGNTFALSAISYVTGDNNKNVGTTQFVGYFGTLQEKGETPEPTDEEKLAAIVKKVSTTVTADFDLDSTVTWAVKSGNAITIEGKTAKVTRPAAGAEDATVVLTATLGNATKDVTITVKAMPSAEIEEVTLADFLTAKDSTEVFYKISGVVVYVENTTFGNIYISDGKTTVYVYGLCAERMSYTTGWNNAKDFNTLGVEAGTYVTLASAKGSFSGNAQAVGSGLIEKRAGTDVEKTYVDKYSAQKKLDKISVDGIVSADIKLDTNAEWTSSNTAAIEIIKGESTVTGKVTRGESDVEVTLTATVTVNGQSVSKEFKVTVLSTATKSKTVTMQYTGAVTTNMAADNNAATVGLDETLFTILSTKTGSNHVGLNKDGTIRLYSGKSCELTISVTEGHTIKSIKVSFGSKSNGTLLVTDGETEITGTSDVYTVNGSKVVLANSKSSGQVHITSIEIIYE